MDTKWVLGHKVTPHDTSGNYDLMMAETPPHVDGPPPHSHNTLEESFLIIEGELEFMVGGEVKTIGAGESIDIPPYTVHTFRNKSDKTCKWVNIHSPKGFRRFFEDVGIPVEEENAKEKSVAGEVIGQVIKTAAEYDMHIQV